MQVVYFDNKIIKTPVILEKGTYKTFNYVIVSYGTHPCCYVEIPKIHPYYHMHYDDIKIECHGGLTFSNYKSFDELPKRKYYIGWDYHHPGDYYLPATSLSGMLFDIHNELIQQCNPTYFLKDKKKWTVKEMRDEIIKVIEQIINVRN